MREEKEEATMISSGHPLRKPIVFMTVAIMLSSVLVSVSILFGSFLLSQTKFSDKRLTGELRENIKENDGAKTEPQAQNGKITVSLDDDPILGDKQKAKVAIVEFSDYECPFCKRFHEETFDKIVKEYVDTGKAVMVFRDFPLSFHEPMASKEAFAANCVQKQAGDKAYFDYGALLFKNTQSNGQGMSEEKMKELASQVGMPSDKWETCLKQNSQKFSDEVAQDQSDGASAGVDGTPAFIIGTLNGDNTVTGVKAVGAQSFAQFQKIIDSELKR